MVFQDDELYACGEEGGGVAGHVHYEHGVNVISWYQPGGRERMYVIEAVLEDSEERFAFRDNRGRKFVLFPLTPEHYNNHIRRPGTPSYPTTASLRKAYEDSLR